MCPIARVDSASKLHQAESLIDYAKPRVLTRLAVAKSLWERLAYMGSDGYRMALAV